MTSKFGFQIQVSLQCRPNNSTPFNQITTCLPSHLPPLPFTFLIGFFLNSLHNQSIYLRRLTLPPFTFVIGFFINSLHDITGRIPCLRFGTSTVSRTPSNNAATSFNPSGVLWQRSIRRFLESSQRLGPGMASLWWS